MASDNEFNLHPVISASSNALFPPEAGSYPRLQVPYPSKDDVGPADQIWCNSGRGSLDALQRGVSAAVGIETGSDLPVASLRTLLVLRLNATGAKAPGKMARFRVAYRFASGSSSLTFELIVIRICSLEIE